jgi:glycine dehydrogenase subunit 1
MTWSYLPHTAADRQAMLSAIGVQSVEELFVDIPRNLRLERPLDLPPALAEPELVRKLQQLAAMNSHTAEYVCFLGAGAYDHYIPSTVDYVISRSEFYTAYTQYQPEIAQGYLQALWEYQSMICEITGMPVANASLYDGGTAVAEAAMLACSALGRQEVIVANTVHPHYRRVLATYAIDRNYQVKEASYTEGVSDFQQLQQLVSKSTAAVIIQNPNFFGSVEDIQAVAELSHKNGAYLIVAVDPISLGVLATPGSLGADIVVGEGQSLGLSTAYGGPYLGFFAVTEKLLRKMPGRVVGQTLDHEGTRGFVLTLQAREQHIRREKATSNICSNEALCALSAAVYLSTMGKVGFREIAELSLQKSHYAYEQIIQLSGCQAAFSVPFFKEFVIKLNRPVAEVNQRLWQDKILGGLDLGSYYPELACCMLLCVTENRTKAEIDALVSRMGAYL